MDGSGTSSGEGCLVSLRPFVSFSEHVCAFGQAKVRASTLKRISGFGSDLDRLGDLTSQPAVQFLRRSLHPPTLVGNWHPEFAHR
jgi:hypothetical protein